MGQYNWVRYWRNTLADVESCKGVLPVKVADSHFCVNMNAFRHGALVDDAQQADDDFSDETVAALFKGEENETLVVQAHYRPTIYVIRTDHGVDYQGNLPKKFSPVVCSVWVTRKGLLYPAGIPHIPRDLLSPQAEDKFTIASLTQHDSFLTVNKPKVFTEEAVLGELESENYLENQSQHWQSYYKLCREMFSEVCFKDDSWADTKHLYKSDINASLVKAEDGANFSLSIIKLYDQLLGSDSSALLTNYAIGSNTTYQTCPDTAQTISLRLGHSNSQFPLADAQRDALSATLQMQMGEILPVNGPPGTGKTTFVLSAVASLWVNAALEDGEPPLIIAASTNNQAVTNIIDAFGKDFGEGDGPLQGRWLPGINSYGGYMPSDSKEKEAAESYQTSQFYQQLEQPNFLESAEVVVCEKAKLAFPELEPLDLQTIKNRLLSELTQRKDQLDNIETVWQSFEQTSKLLKKITGTNQASYIDTLKQSIAEMQDQYGQVGKALHIWRGYLAEESVWLSLFSWLPLVESKKADRRSFYIKEAFCPFIQSIIGQGKHPKRSLKNWQSQHQPILDEKKKFLADLSSCHKNHQQAKTQWQSIAAELEGIDDKCPSLDEVDKQLDVGIRFEMFRLAVHFWEVRWLMACKMEGEKLVANQNKTGKKTVVPRWRRRMMLTPCIVSTFHSLPKHMTYVAKADSVFEKCPLLDEIDLLIVDEAGQVSPEVAGASFALAKKALVIGDIHQIEPVRSLTAAVDIGNLKQCAIMQQDDEYEEVLNSGRSVMNGSVMHIAQQATRYHYQPSAEPGMFLREHRRCYDEIISFCNDLCYNGLLISKRGEADSAAPYPAFGYLHINGRAESPTGGSRCNLLEAETLAAWLSDQRDTIEQTYGDKLEKVVGIVTPFTAQVRTIEAACKRHGILAGKADDRLTIGTVHSLQGAERHLVIFSQVYSRHSDGEFIDMSNTLLNVAVSRAKNSFLVFGDVDIIKAADENKPRGLLAKYLFAHDSNEILFAAQKRPDLIALCDEPRLITNAKEHDAYLMDLLDRVSSCIHIVSPWIIYSKLVETGLLNKLQQIAQKGVEVKIYTDRHFNTTSGNKLDQDKRATFEKCYRALNDSGLDVYVINGVHSKLVMADDKFMGVGSFNWLSAARQGRYANMETSLVYFGDVADETKMNLNYLNKKIYERHES